MSEEKLTKRARQKQRRGLKLEVERREAARARRRRLAAFAMAGLVVAGGIGSFIANVVGNRAEVRARERAVAARLEDLGCTPIEDLTIGDTQHFSGQELASNPPEVAYPDRPAAGGRMAPGVAEAGVYREPVDERLLVHNLEHGYVNMYYDPDAPVEDVEKLRELAAERLEPFPLVVVAPYTEPLPGDANFAAVSWGKRQMCSEYDPDVLLSYVENNHGSKSGAPEAGMGGSGNSSNPVRPGGDGPFLLPPLTAEAPGDAGQPQEGGEPQDGGQTEGGAPGEEPTEAGESEQDDT